MAKSVAFGRVAGDASGKLSFVELLNWYYYEVFIRIHVFVLRVSTFIQQKLLWQRKSSTTRTVLILGDGVAEGVGDTLSQGGLATRMNGLFDAHRVSTALRLPWHVYTLGRLHSTSMDWAPDSKLLNAALLTGPHAHAEVIALVIGSHDDPLDAEESTERVAGTAEAAARLGKHVVVCAFPNYEEPKTEPFAQCRERRRLVADALDRVLERLPEGSGSITWDVDIDKVLARRGDVIRVENKFTTLNSIGYRAFARELFDEVSKAAKKVEWAYWKVQLEKA